MDGFGVSELEWNFFDRVMALTDEVGPGSAEDFPARFPRVLPKGMQVLTGLDYELIAEERWVEVTFTMASRERLTEVTGVEVTPEQHHAMTEEVCLALAFATLRLLPTEYYSITAQVAREGHTEGDEPLALLGFDRPQIEEDEKPDGYTWFDWLGGVSTPADPLVPALAPVQSEVTPAAVSPAQLTPREFELLLKRLLEAMGLTAKETPYSKDDGVDVIAEDHRPFHRGRVVVQAKRYAGSVGVTTVRELNGVLPLHRAQRGIVVTTGTFTREAVATARQLGIELIDGRELRQALAEHLGD